MSEIIEIKEEAKQALESNGYLLSVSTNDLGDVEINLYKNTPEESKTFNNVDAIYLDLNN